MGKKNDYSVPKKRQVLYDAIIYFSDPVCREHLTEEYADLSRRMTAALVRKRSTFLEGGQPKSWAAGVLYTLARVNFLFDPTQTPHMTATELCKHIGVSQSTATKKSNQICDVLDLTQFDPDWTLPSKMDENPLVWHVLYDGYITDIRTLPREVQEDAFRRGIIPYIP